MNQAMELTSRLNGPPRLAGNGLVLVCSYRGGTDSKQPWRMSRRYVGTLVNLLTLFALRQFIGTYRDHYANARNFAYQADLVRAVLERAKFTACDLIVDEALAADAQGLAIDGVNTVTIARIADAASLPADRYDTLVLVYPDALGLSWTGMEARALSAAKGDVVVVNGRRRLFTLDKPVRRKLRWRRFLANTRIVQTAIGILAWPFAAVLTAYDAVRGRS